MAGHASALEQLNASGSFDGELLFDEPMARHTTYRIGGPAACFAVANDLSSLTSALRLCSAEDIPWVLVGKGSNLLVADEGFPGAVIVLGRDFRLCRFDEESGIMGVGAGCLLAYAVMSAYHASRAGLEFAVGTPGTVGGALRMNAGTRDVWLGSRVASVTTFSVRDGLVKRPGTDLSWGYRTSSFAADEVILECELATEAADPFYVHGKMEALLAKRRRTQPLSQPSCGSVFKNPEGSSAGLLIDRAELKGFAIGGAQVSETHANFIVNTGSATAADVRAVMDQVQRTVLDRFGVQLQPEVRFLGFAE